MCNFQIIHFSTMTDLGTNTHTKSCTQRLQYTLGSKAGPGIILVIVNTIRSVTVMVAIHGDQIQVMLNIKLLQILNIVHDKK